MFAGQLEVERITGNKDLEIDAGQLTVDIGRAEDYGQVDGSVTTGQVDASPFNVSKGGLVPFLPSERPRKVQIARACWSRAGGSELRSMVHI